MHITAVIWFSICNVANVKDTLQKMDIPDKTAIEMLAEYARSTQTEGLVNNIPLTIIFLKFPLSM